MRGHWHQNRMTLHAGGIRPIDHPGGETGIVNIPHRLPMQIDA